jgi:S1-C subfamily serine protease
MSARSSFLSSLALLTAFAAGVGVTRMASRESDVSAAGKPAVAGRFEPQARTSSAGQLPDLSSIAERAIQASVNISSTQQVRVDPMVQFFRGGVDFEPQNCLGSGMIVSADGYVLTNSHVVGTRNAEIHVTLGDNRELPATVIGIDPDTDLAVLKVDARGIQPLPWGDSGKLRVAEWVLAIGNPFDYNQTVTLGIVSAQNRHDPQLAIYNDFIQHDAAINPGNSGGALVSGRGELVGINTLIAGNTGGYQGISFAIPSNLARRIMNALIKDGEVVRGSIGNLQFVTLTPEQAKWYGLGASGGVFVSRVPLRDPAYPNGAGFLPKDHVVSFNKTAVTERNELLRLIAEAPIGSTATVEVIRSGVSKTFQLPVVKQTRPQMPGR